MADITITNRQARRFLLLSHGLLGGSRFRGKAGALEYIRRCGCIQFDPVDVCGKNAELTLQSRVKGFQKAHLDELLYKDRALVDYPDKNQAIIPVEDWPYFERYRRAARECGAGFEGLAEIEAQTKDWIRRMGPVSSATLPVTGSISWHSAIHWSGSWHGRHPAGRAALEQLYSTGELVIHHKQGARKYYDLAENHISRALLEAPDPNADDMDHITWRVKRRIGAVGLMWDRPSDAWLHIWDMDAEKRSLAFERLSRRGEIIPVSVEGVRGRLWLRGEDMPMLESAMSDKRFTPRCECLAPLDPLMWDRKLILSLFDFRYSWEIYTPADRRVYGYYTLPVIYGERFAARMEAVPEKGMLAVRNLWPEKDVRMTDGFMRALRDCAERLAAFNGLGGCVFDMSSVRGG